MKESIAFLLLIFIGITPYCQYDKFRSIRISTKTLEVVDGLPWDFDEPSEENLFNNYVLSVSKDSSRVIVYSLTKYFKSAGTRNILSIDSMNRPIEVSGNIDYDRQKYKYNLNWSVDGRLLYIEEYINNSLSRRLAVNAASKRKK